MEAAIEIAHTGVWTLTGDMTAPRREADHAAVPLRDGRVLVPGGYTAHETPVSSTDLYDPRTGIWTAGGSMSDNRTGQSALVLLGNRGVLVMGGRSTSRPRLRSASILVRLTELGIGRNWGQASILDT